MPTSSQILDALGGLARAWQALAIFWHIYVAAFGIALALGWRPVKPLAACLLVAPLITVVVLAWISGNPFTAVVLGVCAVAALGIAATLPRGPLRIASSGYVLAGIALAIFGFVYPHFLESSSWLTYLYAAPVGIVPCPTLSVIVGFGLIVNGFESRLWSIVLGVSGTFYGVFGAVRLGVSLDWVLLAGALLLLVMSFAKSRQS